MSFFYYSNNNNNNSSSSLNISSNNKIDNDNNNSTNNSSINQEEAANKGGSTLEILKKKPRMVLERLKNMSKHMRSVTPTTATSSPSPTPSQSTYGGLYYQDREPINRERSDSKYYLNIYRNNVKKFEEDRKKAIRDFEKNRVARTIAIITQGSVTSPVQMHLKKKTKTVIDMEKSGDKNTNKHDSDKKDKDKKDDDDKSEKPERKRDQFKDKFVEWTSYSTAHGIPNIFRLESQLLKVIWILCFLASFAYCSYTIVNIVIVFLQYGVLINQEVVSEAPVDFPAVTVCNLNAFDKRHAQNYINQVLAANNISYVSNINLIDIPPTQVNNLIKASIIGNTSFSNADIQYMGFSIDYMLLTCYFNNVPCNQSDFRWIYDFDYTNCWQFNSGYDQYGNKVPIRQVNEAGADRSLNLELFIGDDATQSQYMLNSGARVVVHNQSASPIISSEGIDIATGFKTNVAFRRSFLSRLDAPYSDCIKDTSSPDSFESVYYKAIFNTLNMTTYRQKVCFRICLQEYILRECSCIDGSLPNIYKNTNNNNNESSVNVCQTVSLLNCVSSARIEYFSNQNSTLSIECATKHCPLECDSESIEMTTSSSRYPTQYYQGYMSAHTNILSKFPSTAPPELTKTTVYLSVFFDDIATTYTEEIPAITGTTLLGTIGGNLGLFIGASLLTFVEIIELLIEFLFIAFKIHF